MQISMFIEIVYACNYSSYGTEQNNSIGRKSSQCKRRANNNTEETINDESLSLISFVVPSDKCKHTQSCKRRKEEEECYAKMLYSCLEGV